LVLYFKIIQINTCKIGKIEWKGRKRVFFDKNFTWLLQKNIPFYNWFTNPEISAPAAALGALLASPGVASDKDDGADKRHLKATSNSYSDYLFWLRSGGKTALLYFAPRAGNWVCINLALPNSFKAAASGCSMNLTSFGASISDILVFIIWSHTPIFLRVHQIEIW
jgi:hypothetical protein